MGFSQASIFVLTFLIFMMIVVVIKKNRMVYPDVTVSDFDVFNSTSLKFLKKFKVYTLGHREFEHKERFDKCSLSTHFINFRYTFLSGEEEDALLHVTQVLKKAPGNGELLIVSCRTEIF